ncbi:hypothetical protein ACH42_15265 [Endozoicomonas sp. (ex Bugula neritina AB1)]|nr:hypothetical protein ACH42_15265 [Endozoicomonas sp. (ex Bugula neritina AB1)]
MSTVQVPLDAVIEVVTVEETVNPVQYYDPKTGELITVTKTTKLPPNAILKTTSETNLEVLVNGEHVVIKVIPGGTSDIKSSIESVTSTKIDTEETESASSTSYQPSHSTQLTTKETSTSNQPTGRASGFEAPAIVKTKSDPSRFDFDDENNDRFDQISPTASKIIEETLLQRIAPEENGDNVTPTGEPKFQEDGTVYNLKSTGDGTHHYSVKYVDKAGNKSLESQITTAHIDSKAPKVLSISVQETKEALTTGDEIDVTVTFDKHVDVTAPELLHLTLELGDAQALAKYKTISEDGKQIHFSYTVVSGDSAPNGASVSENIIQLPSSIKGFNGLTVKNLPAENLPNLKVDAKAPEPLTIDGLSGETPGGQPFTTGTQEFDIIGSAEVDSRIHLYDAKTDTPIGTEEVRTNEQGNWKITREASQGFEEAEVYATATGSNGNTSKHSDSKIIVTDLEHPSVTDIHGADQPLTHPIGDAITITVIFSEKVQITGTPKLTLELNNKQVQAIVIDDQPPSEVLKFKYLVTHEDPTTTRIVVPKAALVIDDGATIKDSGGNPVIIEASDAYTLHNGINTDPAITKFEPTISKGVLKEGDEILIIAEFNKPLSIKPEDSNWPTVPITLGSKEKSAVLTKRPSDQEMVKEVAFKYVIEVGDDAHNVDIKPIQLNGAIFSDIADAVLVPTSTAKQISLSELQIDTTPPKIDTINLEDGPKHLKGSILKFNVVLTEEVTIIKGPHDQLPQLDISIGSDSLVVPAVPSSTKTTQMVFLHKVTTENGLITINGLSPSGAYIQDEARHPLDISFKPTTILEHTVDTSKIDIIILDIQPVSDQSHYYPGDKIGIEVTTSSPVTCDQSDDKTRPSLSLKIGEETVIAELAGDPRNTQKLLFSFTADDSHHEANGIIPLALQNPELLKGPSGAALQATVDSDPVKITVGAVSPAVLSTSGISVVDNEISYKGPLSPKDPNVELHVSAPGSDNIYLSTYGGDGWSAFTASGTKLSDGEFTLSFNQHERFRFQLSTDPNEKDSSSLYEAHPSGAMLFYDFEPVSLQPSLKYKGAVIEGSVKSALNPLFPGHGAEFISKGYITLPVDAKTLENSFTLCLWGKPSGKGISDSDLGENGAMIAFSSGISLGINAKGHAYAAFGKDTSLTTSEPIASDELQHICLVVDKTNSEYQSTLYVNGQEDNKAPFNILPTQPEDSSNIYIGGHPEGKNTWNGFIDDLQLFPYALDSKRVGKAYTQSAVAQFKPEEGVDIGAMFSTMNKKSENAENVYFKFTAAKKLDPNDAKKTISLEKEESQETIIECTNSDKNNPDSAHYKLNNAYNWPATYLKSMACKVPNGISKLTISMDDTLDHITTKGRTSDSKIDLSLESLGMQCPTSKCIQFHTGVEQSGNKAVDFKVSDYFMVDTSGTTIKQVDPEDAIILDANFKELIAPELDGNTDTCKALEKLFQNDGMSKTYTIPEKEDSDSDSFLLSVTTQTAGAFTVTSGPVSCFIGGIGQQPPEII